jgi:hypothetical protein
MKASQKPAHCDESFIRPAWRGIAREVGEDLSALLVDSEDTGGSLETHLLKMTKKAVHGWRPPADRPTNRVAYSDNTRCHRPAGQHHLFVGHAFITG